MPFKFNPVTGNLDYYATFTQVNSDWDATSGVAQILNKPTIPAAQVNSDWNATSGVAQILNKPGDFTGATPTVNGATGLVPAPTTANVGQYLKGDGSWSNIPTNPLPAGADLIYFELFNNDANNAISTQLSTTPGGPYAWVPIASSQLALGDQSIGITLNPLTGEIIVPARASAIVYEFVATLGCFKGEATGNGVDVGVSIDGANPVLGNYTSVPSPGFTSGQRELSVSGLFTLSAGVPHTVRIVARQTAGGGAGSNTIATRTLNFFVKSANALVSASVFNGVLQVNQNLPDVNGALNVSMPSYIGIASTDFVGGNFTITPGRHQRYVVNSIPIGAGTFNIRVPRDGWNPSDLLVIEMGGFSVGPTTTLNVQFEASEIPGNTGGAPAPGTWFTAYGFVGVPPTPVSVNFVGYFLRVNTAGKSQGSLTSNVPRTVTAISGPNYVALFQRNGPEILTTFPQNTPGGVVIVNSGGFVNSQLIQYGGSGGDFGTDSRAARTDHSHAVFTTSAKGFVPASGSNTNFLRGDGTFQPVPPSYGNFLVTIGSNAGLSNTNNNTEYVFPWNVLNYNDSSTIFTTPGSYNIAITPATAGEMYYFEIRYASYDITNPDNFMRIRLRTSGSLITGTTSGTLLATVDQKRTATGNNGEASVAGSTTVKLNAGTTYFAVTFLHSLASPTGYPVIDNVAGLQPYILIRRLGL